MSINWYLEIKGGSRVQGRFLEIWNGDSYLVSFYKCNQGEDVFVAGVSLHQ